MSSKKSDTKSRIFEATWKLMEDSRGQGVRMSDIAKVAGISRQALYLHFDDRSNLLIATTQYMDEKLGIEDQLKSSREASSGKLRMLEFIYVMGNHFPNIQGVARALLAIKDTDEAASAAWDERMGAIREGCEAAITMLEAEGNLVKGLSRQVATDLLWVLLSFQNWDQLTNQCGWSAEEYITHIQKQAERSFVAH